MQQLNKHVLQQHFVREAETVVEAATQGARKTEKATQTAAKASAQVAQETEAAAAGRVGPQKFKVPGKAPLAAEAPAAEVTTAAEAPRTAPKAGGMREALLVAGAPDKRAAGLAANKRGAEFEQFLQERFGGRESFKVKSKTTNLWNKTI